MRRAAMPLAMAMFLDLGSRVITFGKEAATAQIGMVMKARGQCCGDFGCFDELSAAE